MGNYEVRNGFLQKILLWVLMVQMALPAPLVLAVQRLETTPQAFNKGQSLVGQHPLLTFLEQDHSLAQVPAFEINDPALDADPFFLRSQNWIDALPEPHTANASQQDAADGPLFTTTAQGFIVQAPGSPKALTVNAPLRPIGFTDEYIFLAAQPGSSLFESKSPQGEEDDPTGQGLFILPYHGVLQAQSTTSSVPIYFLPLPGSHWNELAVTVHEFPRQNAIILADGQGFTLPLELDDIEQVIGAENLNLTMALTDSLQKNIPTLLAQPQLQRSAAALEDLFQRTKLKIDSANQGFSAQEGAALVESMTSAYLSIAGQMTAALSSQAVYPLRGSTAGFGIFYTGHDLDAPEGAKKSKLWAQQNSLQKNINSFLNHALEAVSPRSAHAIGMLVEQVPLAAQILRFAAISGLAVIASIALKHTVFHKRFLEKSACESALLDAAPTPPQPQGRFARFYHGIKNRLNQIPALRVVGREIRDVGTVAAHTLTTISQFPSVWFGNLVEFAGDRLAPRYFAGENKLIRRFLVKTVYFVRDASEQLPVSAYTWVMGALVYGGIDTINYYVQLYHSVPAIAFGVAASLPMLKSRIDDAFAVGNPHTGAINQYEVVRCAIYYGNAGASVYSQSWRTQLLSSVTKEVEEEMAALNLNPRDASNQSDRERRIKEKLEAVMRQQGLPGSEEFLFDASTLYSGVMKLFGYKTNDSAGPAVDNDYYWGQERPGLIIPSVPEALAKARLQLQRTPENRALHAAVTMLSELESNLSMLKTFLSEPVETFFTHQGSASEKFAMARRQLVEQGRRFQKVRQELMLLTYEASASAPLRNVPESWKERLRPAFGDNMATEGAKLAAQYFRQAYMAYMTGDPTILGPTPEQRLEFQDRAARYAGIELKRRHEDENLSLAALKSKYNIEFDSILDSQIVEFVKDREALANGTVNTSYRPPQKGMVARWQERRAFRKAQERFLKIYGYAYDGSTGSTDPQHPWNRIYAEAVMNTVGLYPDYAEDSDLKNQIEATSSEMTLNQVQSDPELAAYLERLEPAQKSQFVATLFADNTIKNYLAATVNNAKFPALSSLQPGRLQWFRKTKFFKNSPALTRAARGLETLVSNNSYEFGLKSLLNRNLPLYQDMSQSNRRAYQAAITSGTATYHFNADVYGIHLSPAMWTLNLVSRFLVGGPEQTVNRAFRMQGLQPMGKVHTMIAFAFVFSWATFWGTIPIQIFAGDFNTAWQSAHHALAGPLQGVLGWLRGL